MTPTPASATAVASSTNPVKDWVLDSLNTEWEKLEERFAILRERLVAKGAGFEDRVQMLDDQALRFEELKARVLSGGTIRRLLKRHSEEAEILAIGIRVDKIVAM